MEAVCIKMVPVTWIIAPLATKEQVERYVKKGWLDEEGRHLHRVFPRDNNGKPFIFKMVLRSAVNQVVQELKLNRELVNFQILDDKDNAIDYVVIPETPLRYRRCIRSKEETRTTESFEYIDGTFELYFKVKTVNSKEFVEALVLAGKKGIFSRTKHGYGKFTIEVVPGVKEERKDKRRERE